MFDVTSHEGNTNQKHNEIPVYIPLDGQNKKDRKSQVLFSDMEKLELRTLMVGM